jgi:hypothetical protein
VTQARLVLLSVRGASRGGSYSVASIGLAAAAGLRQVTLCQRPERMLSRVACSSVKGVFLL